MQIYISIRVHVYVVQLRYVIVLELHILCLFNKF